MIPIAIIFISVILVNIFDSSGEIEDGSFNTAPSIIVKNKNVMIFQYVLLILLILAIIILDINKSAKGIINIEPFHINRAMPAIITLVIVCFFLYNTVKYNVKRYNLPGTWKK